MRTGIGPSSLSSKFSSFEAVWKLTVALIFDGTLDDEVEATFVEIVDTFGHPIKRLGFDDDEEATLIAFDALFIDDDGNFDAMMTTT